MYHTHTRTHARRHTYTYVPHTYTQTFEPLYSLEQNACARVNVSMITHTVSIFNADMKSQTQIQSCMYVCMYVCTCTHTLLNRHMNIYTHCTDRIDTSHAHIHTHAHAESDSFTRVSSPTSLPTLPTFHPSLPLPQIENDLAVKYLSMADIDVTTPAPIGTDHRY